jgi:GT2 family glycosyltransferase
MPSPSRGSRSSGSTDQAALDIVIVSFRSRDLLGRCLRSLELNPGSAPTTVQVVDNASGDGTAELVTREFPEVRLRASDRNVGFAAASNLGIGAGTAPYVLLLNPDTVVEQGCLDRLLAVMDARPEVGISGPRLVREDGELDHAAKRTFPTPASALGYFSGMARWSRSDGALARYTAPGVASGPVDAVNGAFMLIRRAVLEQIGGLDEGYWMYMEDLDLCYRASRGGWTVWYEPSATATHVKGGSSGRIRGPRLVYAFHYGMYRFYRKHYASERNPALNLLVYAGIWTRMAATVIVNAVRRAVARVRRAEAS